MSFPSVFFLAYISSSINLYSIYVCACAVSLLVFFFFLFVLKGVLFSVLCSTMLHLPLLRFHCVSVDAAGIEPKTVATSALDVSSSTTRLDLIHSIHIYLSFRLLFTQPHPLMRSYIYLSSHMANGGFDE